jgi:cytochrome P450 family 135
LGAVSRAAELPPGPRSPAAVQKLGFEKRFGPYLERCRARFGDTFTLRVSPGEPSVMISHPEAIEQVFKGDPRVFHAGEGNEPLRPVVGDTSVFVLDEDQHIPERKLMLPLFHGKAAERFGSLIDELAVEEVSRWPVGEPLTIGARMRAVSLDVMISAVFGVRDRDRLGQLKELILKRAFRRVDGLLFDEIASRRQSSDLEDRDDIMSMMIQARREDGSRMSDRELRDALMTALMAGHETTSTGLAWAIERLVRHPLKLERVRLEVAGGEEGYLDAVVKETLRLRPPIGFVHRLLVQPAEIGGWQLPAGTRVFPCIYLVHRRPDVYPEPAVFLPERFLDHSPGTYTWIPFGGGIRRCIGAPFALFEMKRILATVVSQARLRPSRPEPERAVRGWATIVPERDAEVVVESLAERVGGDGRGRRLETGTQLPA